MNNSQYYKLFSFFPGKRFVSHESKILEECRQALLQEDKQLIATLFDILSFYAKNNWFNETSKRWEEYEKILIDPSNGKALMYYAYRYYVQVYIKCCKNRWKEIEWLFCQNYDILLRYIRHCNSLCSGFNSLQVWKVQLDQIKKNYLSINNIDNLDARLKKIFQKPLTAINIGIL